MQLSRLAALALLPAVLTAAGCGTTDTPSAPETVYVTKTVTVTPPATEDPAEPDPPADAGPSSETPDGEPETFTMPRLVGKNLQLAQDELQHLGSYLLDQQDALGLDRFQVLDSNWKVCSQKPKAGRMVSLDTMVVLAAVKLDETCP